MHNYREIEKGKYANSDIFAHYEVVVEKRDVLLLSDQRVLYCVKNDLFGGWQVSNKTLKHKTKTLLIGRITSRYVHSYIYNG